jgi:gamma-glutamylcyclotransferase (GGCT)/AIG2-like uncharacterized protein YtfP
MLYFAYGSNMSTARLRARLTLLPRYVGVAFLLGYRLVFHKVGMDGSAKCDALCTDVAGDVVFGVLFRIDADEKPLLDACEGSGYAERQVQLFVRSGQQVSAFTYCATHIDDGLKPFDWYRQHVLCGAVEHGLPDYYIQRIAAVDAVADPDTARRAREMAIYR